MYKSVYGMKIYGAIFYNHESEFRPEEYVTRKITKAVARIFYGKQKILKLGDIKSTDGLENVKTIPESVKMCFQSKS